MVKGKIADIEFPALSLHNNIIDIYIGLEGMPKFEIDSSVKFLGAEEKATIGFKDGMLSGDIKITGAGTPFDLEVDFGIGISTKSTPIPEIFFEAEITSDMNKWLSQQLPATVDKFFKVLNADLKAVTDKIDTAQRAVNKLLVKIAARKAYVQKEKAAAESSIRAAQSKVRKIDKVYKYNIRKGKDAWSKCGFWHPGWCLDSAGYYTAAGLDKTAEEAALVVLEAAKQTVDHLPAELMDPELDGLETEYGLATAALQLAKSAIGGLESVDGWMKTGINDLLAIAAKADVLELKSAMFQGDTTAIAKGAPVILSFDLAIFKQSLGNQKFAFQLGVTPADIAFNLEQIAFVSLHIAQTLFKEHAPAFLQTLMGPINNAIANELKVAEKSAVVAFKKCCNVSALSAETLNALKP
jgi:hypothetical protein